MISIFLHSEMRDPFSFYEMMLEDNPVYWDEANQSWAIYSYEACMSMLNNPAAHIPAVKQNNEQELNQYALQITGHLARLSNDIKHQIARETAMLLFERMKSVPIPVVVDELLQSSNGKGNIDWVTTICKTLPVTVILKSFGFNEKDRRFIAGNIAQLVKIMQPVRTTEQRMEINNISREIYLITEEHLFSTDFHQPLVKKLAEKYNRSSDEITALCVSNLIGLFIQGYDAGRGILSNAFLQILENEGKLSKSMADKEFMRKSVIETLRFDPPVHNTRRIAYDDIALNDIKIKKGEAILIVLAAANRDAKKFNNPNKYDAERLNNSEHLTFGSGPHACVANHFTVSLATDALFYFFARYNSIRLLEKNIQYEPLGNVRLPKNILIHFE